MLYATITDFGGEFGLSRSSVYNLISEGKLRAVKAGGRTLIDIAAAKAWLDNLPPAPIRCSTRRKSVDTVA